MHINIWFELYMEGFFYVERGAVLLAFGARIFIVFHR